MTGKVWLLGAGPGDPELLTLKAARILAQADVILYDRLVNPAILAMAQNTAQLIYVGKEPGRHAMSQDQINATLIRHARNGETVARLKGGDPFVFGRGGEEALACQRAGVPFAVIPGVTSAIAVPAYAGIPVTHRGMAHSFAVVNGHQQADAFTSQSFQQLAQGADTLVCLMGHQQLPELVAGLLAAGRLATEPAAAITWGTLPQQRTVSASLTSLPDAVTAANLGRPLIIVVGQVVTLHQALAWFVEGVVTPTPS